LPACGEEVYDWLPQGLKPKLAGVCGTAERRALPENIYEMLQEMRAGSGEN